MHHWLKQKQGFILLADFVLDKCTQLFNRYAVHCMLLKCYIFCSALKEKLVRNITFIFSGSKIVIRNQKVNMKRLQKYLKNAWFEYAVSSSLLQNIVLLKTARYWGKIISLLTTRLVAYCKYSMSLSTVVLYVTLNRKIKKTASRSIVLKNLKFSVKKMFSKNS